MSDPFSGGQGIFAVLAAKMNTKLEVGQIANALIIASLTAAATTYTTVRALETEILNIHREIQRIDVEVMQVRAKNSQIEIRQAQAIAERDGMVKSLQERIVRMEQRK